ncbi:MAG: hypothetical protein R3B96_10300 [Pirellulaceae bacterium]
MLMIDDDPDITWFVKVALAYDNVIVLRDHDGQRGSLDALQESPGLDPDRFGYAPDAMDTR